MIYIHVITVIPALFLGLVLYFRSQRDRWHKLLGKVWMSLMIVTATSSLWINGFQNGAFSWIHLLSLWTLGSVVVAFKAIKQKKVRQHQQVIRGLIIGTSVAGFFALMPSRLLGGLLFGQSWFT